VTARNVVEATAADAVKPGVDDLDAAYAEIRREPYVFTWAAREWALPHIGDLDYRILAEIENYQSLDVTQLLGLFTRMFGPDQAEAWADVSVPTPVLYLLFEHWLEHGGAKLGESAASKPSSGSTGRKSRPTSAANTTSASRKPSTAKRAPRKAASPRAKSST
jgi:hypothetical protein